MKRFLLIIPGLLWLCQCSFSQEKEDTLIVKNDSVIVKSDSVVTTVKSPIGKTNAKDTVAKKKYSPRTAALRSAVLPGWGQAYNKKYWKMPIVYGALGVTAAVFNFNLVQYNRIQYAYRVLIRRDTANYKNVDADLQPFIEQNASSALRSYRNEYRKNIDYSVLFFILFWGLNVVDATVDAHLKGFDVSNDLSLKVKPGYSPATNTAGLTLVFDIHKGKPKMITLP